MIKGNKFKIVLCNLDESFYFVTLINEHNQIIDPHIWKNWLFSKHHETYYGTMIDVKHFKKMIGVKIDGWQLISLLAQEQFNPFVNWDWCELSQLCLAVAPVIYEAIINKYWLPDFSDLENSKFRWSLPESVKQEFDPSFWTETITYDLILEIDKQPILIKTFVKQLFNDALNSYIRKDNNLTSNLSQKLLILKKSKVPFHDLAAFFDKDSWLEWAGLKEDKLPFSIGLRLEEPEEDGGDWYLEPFLRGKENEGELFELNSNKSLPNNWRPFLKLVDQKFEQIAQLVPFLKNDGRLTNRLTENEAWIFLTTMSELLLTLGIEILLPSWWQAIKDSQLKAKIRIKGSGSSHSPSYVGMQALLNFDWRFSMNGVDLSEEEFQQLVEEKRKLVFIKGRWMSLDPKMVYHIQDLLKRAKKEGLHVRDLLQQELIYSDEKDRIEHESDHSFKHIQFELSQQWKVMIKHLTELNNIPDFPVPSGFNGKLRPYQKQGMNWLLFLRQHGFGACLADDMGLGKTIQLISYLLSLKEQGHTNPALIVCPTSVLGNWQKEMERFAPTLNIYLHYGKKRLKERTFIEKVDHYDVVLTSYSLVSIDLELLKRIHWNTVAIDEAQNIKNSETKQSRAVRSLSSQHQIALTGTPMENRLSELWSIFDFINRGYLGSLRHFQKEFVFPIEKDNDTNKIQRLQALIKPFLLRRTKKDEDISLNLPNKQEQKEYCPLTSEQASLYEQLVADTFGKLEQLSAFERKGLVLQMINKLKQLCNHPSLYLKEKLPQSIVKRSIKLQKLVELVGAVLEQKESCLIFTQYIKMGELIQTALKETYHLDVPFLNGAVLKSQRDEMIRQFQSNKFPILLLSLKAGGTGLNLTVANHVFHFDRWWNPAVENQATDRAYRIGQKRFVHVHKFISTGTLEEKIDEMIERKQALNNEIIQSDNWITELSTTELKKLVFLS
ncbi:DEAD/DEAH box helicase [Bacillus aquiflavi]|uniref:DEAD/DEAH box helicase n=1 Tax=Bacillus aquiflavi TaxID=2672567 RepID=A0A6B3VS14_9BACI|nr:DEAD/DEAH box helicase [Bacillus aquiflavi]MBA4536672.1 DEAD/DEAH box helicase [Bacillus aquiflavi]NEY81040.1 DEAD/DEAH box helicase [Bacillus aquiflavi]UAC47889.1 DEAD/DEAH box helicase [Bacillus aquiflavi]